MKELKSYNLWLDFLERVPFNRTMKELKCERRLERNDKFIAFNRTMKELKWWMVPLLTKS